MPRTTKTAIELRTGALAASDLVVRRVAGQECLSDPYSFDLEFYRFDEEPLALADLGGADALLSLRRPDGSERHVNGMLWAVEMVQVVNGKARYRARLVPKLERLRHVRRSRVFQATRARSSTGRLSRRAILRGSTAFSIGNQTWISSTGSSRRRGSSTGSSTTSAIT